jgi:hypothetical protein
MYTDNDGEHTSYSLFLTAGIWADLSPTRRGKLVDKVMLGEFTRQNAPSPVMPCFLVHLGRKWQEWSESNESKVLGDRSVWQDFWLCWGPWGPVDN